jgi:hypothetical protein
MVLDGEEIEDGEGKKEEDLFADVEMGGREGAGNGDTSEDAETASKGEGVVNGETSAKAEATGNGETVAYDEGDINGQPVVNGEPAIKTDDQDDAEVKDITALETPMETEVEASEQSESPSTILGTTSALRGIFDVSTEDTDNVSSSSD